MLLEIIIYLIFALISNIVVYIVMKTIDKKEREKLKNWEDSYIDELIEHRKKLESMPKIEEKYVSSSD